MVTVLITEAHDGLGLALVKEYLADADNQVVAFCGEPTKRDDLNALKVDNDTQLLVVDVNLADEDSIKASVAPIEEFVDALDLLIFNLGFIPDEWLNHEVNADDIPRDIMYDYIKGKIWNSPSWLKQSLFSLLEKGEKSKIIGFALCIPRQQDEHIVFSLMTKGSPMHYSKQFFRAFTHDVNPSTVTAIHLNAIHPDNCVIDEQSLDVMKQFELIDQNAIDNKATSLFENIIKLPHGKHFIIELHTVTGAS